MATYGIAVWRLSRVPAISDFDKLAIYASMGVILYGMSAVVVDLGGQAVFYTIGAIIKFFDERKTERNANAVRIVSNDNDLTAQVIREIRRSLRRCWRSWTTIQPRPRSNRQAGRRARPCVSLW